MIKRVLINLSKQLLILVLVLAMGLGPAIPVKAAAFASKQTKATTNSVTISWTEYSGAAYYVLLYYRKGQDQSEAKKIKVQGKTSYTIKNLKAGAIYYETVEVYSLNHVCIEEEAYFHAAVTLPGKVTDVNPYNWDSDGKGCSFNLKKNPYEAAEAFQWKVTDRTGKKVKAKGVTTQLSFRANSLNANQVYRLYVRPRATIMGKNAYGAWSWKYIVPQPKFRTFTLVNNKNINVKWSKISGATGYIVYGATSANGPYKKIASVGSGKTNYVVSKVNGKSLVKYKNYYFKVKAIYKKGSETYKSLTKNYYGCYIYNT